MSYLRSSYWIKYVALFLTLIMLVSIMAACGKEKEATPSVIGPNIWDWQNPLPQGNSLSCVWGSSGSDVFAMGNSNAILHYDGSNWSSMSGGTSNVLEGVWGNSGRDVFAVGYIVSYSPDGGGGTILHYDGSNVEINIKRWSEERNR